MGTRNGQENERNRSKWTAAWVAKAVLAAAASLLSQACVTALPQWQNHDVGDGSSLTRDFSQIQPPQAHDRILVIAPHIDDEVLGAGGFVADAVNAGADVFVVYLTGGDYSRLAVLANRFTFFATAPLNRKAYTRMAESHRSAERLGLNPSRVILLGYPDRSLDEMVRHPDRTVRSAATGKKTVPYPQAISPGAPYRLKNLHADLESILRRIEPTLVIGPIEEDHHPDHHASAVILGQVLEGKKTARIGYLIHAWKYHAASKYGSRKLAPPQGLREGAWSIYPLKDSTRHVKGQALAEFRTQRRTPYMRTLFNSLHKENELFVRYQ